MNRTASVLVDEDMRCLDARPVHSGGRHLDGRPPEKTYHDRATAVIEAYYAPDRCS